VVFFVLCGWLFHLVSFFFFCPPCFLHLSLSGFILVCKCLCVMCRAAYDCRARFARARVREFLVTSFLSCLGSVCEAARRRTPLEVASSGQQRVCSSYPFPSYFFVLSVSSVPRARARRTFADDAAEMKTALSPHVDDPRKKEKKRKKKKRERLDRTREQHSEENRGAT
jgi:hypothetical protein